MTILAVPTERSPGERRVALVPDAVARLTKGGMAVHVEAGAGTEAGYPDAAYEAAGATVTGNAETALRDAAIVARVRAPSGTEVGALGEGAILVALLNPSANASLLETLASRRVSAFSLELVPRITRAQSMDVLSSQSTVAGYKAVLLAAAESPRLLPMLTTAAGTIPPARVFVIGAGVAGLQAIATARRLGAVVSAFDVRAAAKEQVQSLGASFVEAEVASAEAAGGYARAQTEDEQARTREALADHLAGVDVVITTAQIPGRAAPRLITAEMVSGMKPGSVVFDLAAETGGNCELTVAGERIVHHGVVILGPVNVPATVPFHASQMFSKNVETFLRHLAPEGTPNIDLNDEITGGMCVTHEGAVRFGRSQP